MTIKLGSDIVYIPKFEKALRSNREYFIQNVFSQEELEYPKPQRLASIFATKEAVTKALGITPGKWKEIEVAYEASGKPYLAKFPQAKKSKRKWKHELSISHDGDYVIANIIFYQ